jgi:hypothetical protein
MASLSRKLLGLFAKGELPATVVHDIASAAFEDGWGRDNRLARRIVGAGSAGEHRNHVARDLVRAAEDAGYVCSMAQPYKIELTTGGSAILFLPHEFWPGLVEKFGSANLCLSDEEVQGNTHLARLLREWAAGPDVNFDGDLTTIGVFGLHGDGVSYTSSLRAGSGKSAVVASINLISGQGDRMRGRRQPIFVVQKGKFCRCGCSGFHTYQELFGVFAWSMQWCARGLTPGTRHDGSPFRADEIRVPGGQIIPRACLLQVRGDWEWYEHALRVRSVKSDSFCWKCNATRLTPGPLHFSNFDEAAAHRGTVISNEEYLRNCMMERSEPSILFACPGFKLDFLTVDSMHAGDLGAFQDALGSLLWLEISNKQWHPNRAAGLQWLNGQLDAYYTANPGLTKASPLALTQIIADDPGFPLLKAKASEVRHMIGFGLVLARMHRDGTPTRPAFSFKASHRLVGRSAYHCGQLVELFEGLHGYMSACAAVPFDPAACRSSMYRHLKAAGNLHRVWRTGVPEGVERGIPFHLRPKAHMLQHLVHESIDLYGSPSTFWCYGDEDFVGKVKKLPHVDAPSYVRTDSCRQAPHFGSLVRLRCFRKLSTQ